MSGKDAKPKVTQKMGTRGCAKILHQRFSLIDKIFVVCGDQCLLKMFYQTDSWHDVECLLFAVISVHSGKCLAICHPVVEAALASVLSQLVSKLLAITLPDQSSTSLEIHFFPFCFS